MTYSLIYEVKFVVSFCSVFTFLFFQIWTYFLIRKKGSNTGIIYDYFMILNSD